MTREEAIDIIKCLAWHTRPDEEDVEQAIKVLKQESCEDCISRQAVLDGIEELKKSPWATDKRGIGFEYLITEALEVVEDLCVKQLPPITPKPKTGHWKLIQRGKFVDICCSECGHIRVKGFAYNYNAKDVYNSFQYEEFMKTSHLNFCENCGAKMEGTTE